MTTLDHPLLLSSILVPKPWGGHRLAAIGRTTDTTTAFGESWDVADLPQDATSVPDPVSRVTHGPLAGYSLSDLLERHPDELLGDARRSADGRFPLLVKVLDARETLSLQVHPPHSLDATRAKTESWIVLDAVDGAELLLGVQPGVTLEDVRATIGRAALLDHIARVPARAGDVIHVPAGTIHALGAGVLVAEVQTPSDVTHRLWDWPNERRGGRELHVAAGLQDVEAGWEHNLGVDVAPATDGLLVATDAYSLHRSTVGAGEPLPAEPDASCVRVVMVLDGALSWTRGGDALGVTWGSTVVLPATCETAPVAGQGGATVLVATPA